MHADSNGVFCGLVTMKMNVTKNIKKRSEPARVRSRLTLRGPAPF